MTDDELTAMKAQPTAEQIKALFDQKVTGTNIPQWGRFDRDCIAILLAEVARLRAYLVEASEARYDWEAKAKAAEAEVARLRQCLGKQDHDIQQILGAALRYPRYCDDQANFPSTTEADGVCTGEHTAETIAEEAAEVIQRLRRIRDNLLAAFPGQAKGGDQ